MRDLATAVAGSWLAAALVVWAPERPDSTTPDSTPVRLSAAPPPLRAAPVAGPPTRERVDEPSTGMPPPASASPRVPGAEDVARGASFLDGDGAFPALVARYEGLHSFAAYARSMQELGARFVVLDGQRIVGRIDPDDGGLREGAPTGRFSPRARDYGDEPALEPWTRAARTRFGPRARVLLLVPRRLDAALFGAIDGALDGSGEGAGAFVELEGRYERAAGGGLRFRLEQGRLRDGRLRELSGLFALSGPGEPEG